jgi:hypothetical protein
VALYTVVQGGLINALDLDQIINLLNGVDTSTQVTASSPWKLNSQTNLIALGGVNANNGTATQQVQYCVNGNINSITTHTFSSGGLANNTDWGGAIIVPRVTGRMFYIIEGYGFCDTAGGGATIYPAISTTLRTAGATAVFGDYAGNLTANRAGTTGANSVQWTSAIANANVPFTMSGVVGAFQLMTIGTTYYFDVDYAQTGIAGTMSLKNMTAVFIEF